MQQDPARIRVADLFEPEPSQWGLRGDPFLWRELRERLGEMPLPVDPSRWEALLAQAFEALTAHAPSGQGSVFIERYSHGGLSSGKVSLDFWRETAIPLLLSRLRPDGPSGRPG